MVDRKRKCLLLRKKILILHVMNLLMHQFIDDSTITVHRRWSVHPIWRKRKEEGDYHTLLACMRNKDHDFFRRYTRMSPDLFDKLEKLIAGRLLRVHHSRAVISPGERLAITLRFLATGDSYQSIAFAFRCGISTVHYTVIETCNLLWDVLKPTYLTSPTESEWQTAADEFGRMWQFPNCCGAVDGKHIVIQQPKNSGTMFYNYKGTNSIVLMAVVGPDYRFIAVDIGAYGSQSDGGVFKLSWIGKALEANKLNLPAPKQLPRSETIVPHVLVGDEAFQLRSDFMRPHPADGLDAKQRIFNYRLSRARRCSKNAFGLMAGRWRVFRRPISLSPVNVDAVVKATVVLHNYLLTEEQRLPTIKHLYCPPGYVDFIDHSGSVQNGQWHTDLSNNPASAFRELTSSTARNFALQASFVRKTFTDYFYSKSGLVPWQWQIPGVVDPYINETNSVED